MKMTKLARLAARELEDRALSGKLERVWQRAALTTIASSQPVDPSLAELMPLTAPARAWADVPAWPMEEINARYESLRATHLLAIALGQAWWLAQLDACWVQGAGKIEDLAVLRARGEIRLAQGEQAWDPDELELLLDEQLSVADAPSERAWLALANGDKEQARCELAAYDDLLAAGFERWQLAPDDGIRQILCHPGTVLRVEARALGALIARG